MAKLIISLVLVAYALVLKIFEIVRLHAIIEVAAAAFYQPPCILIPFAATKMRTRAVRVGKANETCG